MDELALGSKDAFDRLITSFHEESAVEVRLSPRLLERIYCPDLPGVTHADHIRAKKHQRTLLPMLFCMDFMSAKRQDPRESLEIGELCKEGAGDVR